MRNKIIKSQNISILKCNISNFLVIDNISIKKEQITHIAEVLSKDNLDVFAGKKYQM